MSVFMLRLVIRPQVRRAVVFRATGCVLLSCCLVAGATGCSGPEPQTPAAAARERVEFLRRHGRDLSPSQVQQIRRVPYGSTRQTNRRMQGILQGLEDERGPDGRRVRVSSLLDKKEDSKETEDPQGEDQTP